MKYRKKSQEVEAFNFGVDNMPSWFMDKVSDGIVVLKNMGKHYEHLNDTYCLIEMPNNRTIRINKGIYIIKYENGFIGTHTQEIFEKEFEKVKNVMEEKK
ncbi:hypothetical protein [Cetobacterium sp.]|uniref:hypothetical protein n=1 Tax=Cetobacterium sp. TaxID=2071632 RepID=UPI003EE74AAC